MKKRTWMKILKDIDTYFLTRTVLRYEGDEIMFVDCIAQAMFVRSTHKGNGEGELRHTPVHSIITYEDDASFISNSAFRDRISIETFGLVPPL